MSPIIVFLSSWRSRNRPTVSAPARTGPGAAPHSAATVPAQVSVVRHPYSGETERPMLRRPRRPRRSRHDGVLGLRWLA
jgi:hypothetical protein